MTTMATQAGGKRGGAVFHWQVATQPGELLRDVRLEPVDGADGSVSPAQGREAGIFRLERDAWPAGWYELQGRLDGISRPQAAPCLLVEFSGRVEPASRIRLPYPRPDGELRMLVLLTHPADALFFDPGSTDPRLGMDGFRFRRVSRQAALREMLTGAETSRTVPSTLRRSGRFALQGMREGLSAATDRLFRNYRGRALTESFNAYIQRASSTLGGTEAADVDVGAHEGSSPSGNFDVALARFTIDASSTASPEDDALRLVREYRLLAGSGLFDADFYLLNYPDVREAGIDPLLHFCQYGWQALRSPRADFDVWWYWATHLDPARETINPLVHYALVGREAGLETLPGPYRPQGAGHVLPASGAVRRACLFAGYDPDGLVDDSVVDYLRELSRHADVWYLADGSMRPGELEKLSGIVRGAWAERHGAYDFGSWSALARDLVGWEVLRDYDEVVLANDSCYLLRPLDDVFARMDALPCDWWGMQATKGLYATRDRASNRFRTPIPMERVKRELLPRYASEHPYDFHVGSYFLALRKPVIADAGFRRRLDAVVPQARKANIIGKYEIGIDRYLMAGGHPFETFIGDLYPFHPVYSQSAFTLIAKGFPFLKRYLLAENHYRVPGLADWKQKVLREVPEAPVERIERHLLRVSRYDKLHRNLGITVDKAGQPVLPRLLDDKAFARADAATPTHDDWWAFPVCAFTHRFTGNERAVFEAVKDDPSIRKIVLARNRHVDVDGRNVVVVPLFSPEGQQYLMQARQIFIKHSPTRNIVFPVSPQRHNIINLWHGVPLKRIGYASLDMRDKLQALAEEHRKCRAVIAASRVDAMAMASAFYPLSYNDMWVTGLPRHDFITRADDALPVHMREQSARLQDMLAGRKLVLFVPTFRHGQGEAYYHFSHAELEWLRQWLDRNHAVIGVREHMADKARIYGTALGTIGALDLGDTQFEDVEVLYRHAALLLTDYSSCFIDFMLTGRPAISFAYDFDRYVHGERGLFYDMEQVFPGPVCRSFSELQAALEDGFDPPGPLDSERRQWQRQLLLDYADDGNALRVVRKVKGLYGRVPPTGRAAG